VLRRIPFKIFCKNPAAECLVSCLEKRFKEKYGTVICSEIIGAKFPEDMQRIKDENLTKGCAALTAYACEILDELL